MTHTKYQKYVFGLKSSHLKIGANGAGAYTIPRSVSYVCDIILKNKEFKKGITFFYSDLAHLLVLRVC